MSTFSPSNFFRLNNFWMLRDPGCPLSTPMCPSGATILNGCLPSLCINSPLRHTYKLRYGVVWFANSVVLFHSFIRFLSIVFLSILFTYTLKTTSSVSHRIFSSSSWSKINRCLCSVILWYHNISVGIWPYAPEPSNKSSVAPNPYFIGQADYCLHNTGDIIEVPTASPWTKLPLANLWN